MILSEQEQYFIVVFHKTAYHLKFRSEVFWFISGDHFYDMEKLNRIFYIFFVFRFVYRLFYAFDRDIKYQRLACQFMIGIENYFVLFDFIDFEYLSV